MFNIIINKESCFMEQNENQEVELDMNHLMKVRKEKLLASAGYAR